MCDLVALEELDRPLVLFSGGAAAESAEVPPAAGLRILLARVEAVLPGFEFPNHWPVPAFERLSVRKRCVRPPTGAAPRSSPGATTLSATRHSGLRASAFGAWRANAAATAAPACDRPGLRLPRSCVSRLSHSLAAAAASLRRAVPSTGQSPRPAWPIVRRACLRECDGSLRERTRPPAWMGLCLRACHVARVSGSPARALRHLPRGKVDATPVPENVDSALPGDRRLTDEQLRPRARPGAELLHARVAHVRDVQVPVRIDGRPVHV